MYSLVRIAIAATKVNEMVHFYEQVFKAQFQSIKTEHATFYAGQMGGIALTLIPNSVAQVKAEQNRQQLSFVVDDIHKVLALAEKAGGKNLVDLIETPEGKQAAVTDPDGNTIEFLQK